MLTETTRHDYALAVDAADRRGAITIVGDLLSAGIDPLDVLTGLITPSQEAVGHRWQQGECTVAQEHAATGVAEAAVATVEAWIAEPADPRGHVVVACAEQEWHALAARMLAESIRHLGWRTTFLGASTPARYLGGYLQHLRPDAMILSCTVPAALAGARAIVRAAAAVGVPTLVGGRALGADPSRAAALGASGWAATPQEVATVLPGLRLRREPLPAPCRPDAEEQAEALMHTRELFVLARLAWGEAPGAACLHDLDAGADAAADHAIHALAATVLTGDSSVLRDADAWLVALLTARGCEPEAVAQLWAALAGALGDQFPTARALLRTGLGTG